MVFFIILIGVYFVIERAKNILSIWSLYAHHSEAIGQIVMNFDTLMINIMD